MPGFSDFLLYDVLCLPDLWRNLLSLVHIRKQGHYIYMFDGQVEIKRSSNNMIIMTGWEDGKLLKLKGTYEHAHNFSYLSHHDKGTLSSSLLWHARFGHVNCDSLCMLKKNGVSSLPTIPRNL
jgi:hypothetical protein